MWDAVEIVVPQVGILGADLTIVSEGGPLVAFAHGAGSSRHSPRNQAVARRLQQDGFGTLLLDLMTTREEAVEQRGGRLRFDVETLADRLLAATGWLERLDQPPSPVGYFGASTGAAAALIAAARQPEGVGAVVSRGGRPDLAGRWLGQVRAPTLLIVGGDDRQVLELNERALAQLPGEKSVEIVPGASHLFEEPGTLEQVADLAADWFGRYLRQPRSG